MRVEYDSFQCVWKIGKLGDTLEFISFTELFSNAYCHDNHLFINQGSECNTDGIGNKVDLPSALFSLRDIIIILWFCKSDPQIWKSWLTFFWGGRYICDTPFFFPYHFLTRHHITDLLLNRKIYAPGCKSKCTKFMTYSFIYFAKSYMGYLVI